MQGFESWTKLSITKICKGRRLPKSWTNNIVFLRRHGACKFKSPYTLRTNWTNWIQPTFRTMTSYTCLPKIWILRKFMKLAAFFLYRSWLNMLFAPISSHHWLKNLSNMFFIKMSIPMHLFGFLLGLFYFSYLCLYSLPHALVATMTKMYLPSDWYNTTV